MAGSFFEFKPLSFRGEVAVVAPSSPFDKSVFNAGVTEMKLNKLRPVIDKAVFAKAGFLAGSDDERAEQFVKAFTAEKVEAVWTARGGYGALRLLEKLDENIDKIKANPKLFIGFSDVTVLHSWLVEKCGFVTVHGPNVTTLSKIDRYSKAQIFDLLTGKDRAFSIFSKNIRTINPGKVKGTVKGGNLATLVSLLGTPYEPDFKDSILFIEDVGERHYHIDRMMNNLRMSGVLARIKGFVVGQFTDCEDDPLMGCTVSQTIAQAVESYTFPVLFDFPAGHVEDNCPLWLNTIQQLSVTEKLSTLAPQ